MPDSANYIGNLNAGLPAAGDPLTDGDNEIRTIKRAIKNSLPGDPEGVYNDDDPDLWDSTGILELGPRYLNSVPALITALQTALATLAENSNFVGKICMYSGLEANIPDTWAICNGDNGTPDLRGKFILGPNYGSVMPGDTGGSTSTVTDAGGGHTPVVEIAATALTIDQMPLHGHSYNQKTGAEGSTQSGGNGGLVVGNATTRGVKAAFTGTPSDNEGEQIGGTGGGATHTHVLTPSAVPDHTHTLSIIPPWYALAYVMYIGE